jgi:hypothetical protein
MSNELTVDRQLDEFIQKVRLGMITETYTTVVISPELAEELLRCIGNTWDIHKCGR